MSSAAPGPSSANLNGAGTQKQAVFEFTRRKRWADLLVTELSEAVILILSPACKIWFCGNAVSELLGWRDEELIDGDMTDIMNVDDQIKFLAVFNDSIRMNSELLSYVRLKCKNKFHQDSRDYSTSPKEVLFEVKGYPHFVRDQVDCKCFFAMARPYPSRNTAMLNTFLELKMENERLQQRLRDLRSRQAQTASRSSSTSLSQVTGDRPSYSGYSMPLSMPMTVPAHFHGNVSETYYSRAGTSVAPVYDNTLQSNYDSTLETRYRVPSFSSSHMPPDTSQEDDEEGSRRKKLKKTHISDQHVCVTCGRTDSPEWRKGPLGPKTLCNACGLRWAKQQRKFDVEPSDSSNQDTSGSHSQGSSSGLLQQFS